MFAFFVVLSYTCIDEKVIISMVFQTGDLPITSCYGLKFIQFLHYPQIINRPYCILQQLQFDLWWKMFSWVRYFTQLSEPLIEMEYKLFCCTFIVVIQNCICSILSQSSLLTSSFGLGLHMCSYTNCASVVCT